MNNRTELRNGVWYVVAAGEHDRPIAPDGDKISAKIFADYVAKVMNYAYARGHEAGHSEGYDAGHTDGMAVDVEWRQGCE